MGTFFNLINQSNPIANATVYETKLCLLQSLRILSTEIVLFLDGTTRIRGFGTTLYVEL